MADPGQLPWIYPYREDPQSTRLGQPVFRPFVQISLAAADRGLEHDLVFPAVAEVVLVEQAIARCHEQRPERHLAVGADVELRIWESVAIGPALEHMEVGVLPSHRGSEHLMKTIQTDVGRHSHPPPDLRIG